jgi:ABC-type sugar transport system ATPase subunit
MTDAGVGIRLRGIEKRYGSTVALNGLDLDIAPGEILGVAGPNGAGKSTLVRIIGGEESPTSGTLMLDGQPWSPTEQWNVVSIVHQEPQLFPNLTVSENVVAGRERGRTAWPTPSSDDLQIMDAMGLGPVRDSPLGECSLAVQQRTEIARAAARDARVFLFDEPNSALTDAESDELFREMRTLAKSGRVVLLITHRLGDLVRHCARVAVVRDGRVRAILSGSGLTEDSLARQLVTEGGAGTSPASSRASAGQDAEDAPMFLVRRWTGAGAFRDIDFSAPIGQIVALMGVEGSGARELLRSFAGFEHATGEIELNGATDLRHLRAYVPATRALSLYSNFSVGENLLVRLGVPDIAGRLLDLKKNRMATLAQKSVKRFLIKTPTTTIPIRALSGGNQQKVAIAQALNCSPELLLLEEPTRGVDIHSKNEIYHLLRDYAASGKAVIIFCTEVLEIFEVADCAYVVAEGRLSQKLTIADYRHVEQLATDVAKLEQRRSSATADGHSAF